MGKNNVNPNHYKIAGRDRQGEDILQARHKERFALNQARERFEQREPLPFTPAPPAQEEEASGGADGATEDMPRAEPAPDRRAARPARQSGTKAVSGKGAKSGRGAKKKATAQGRKTASAGRKPAGARAAKGPRTPAKNTGSSRAKKASPSRKKKTTGTSAGRASGAKKGASRSGRR